MTFLFVLSIATFVFVAVFGFFSFRGALRMAWLDDIPALNRTSCPLVSVVIPALNEEKNIRKALLSVLVLDYRPLEIIVVNDRSTDTTGAVLEEIAAEHAGLKVLHVRELPAGWLGKKSCSAPWRGTGDRRLSSLY